MDSQPAQFIQPSPVSIQREADTTPPPGEIASDPNHRKNVFRLIIIVSCLFFVIGLAGFLFKQFTRASMGDELLVENQPIGNTFHIKKVRTLKDGFVQIHNKSRLNKPADTIGQSDFMSADTYENIQIDLSDAVVQNGLSLNIGDELFAILYHYTDANYVSSQIAKDVNGKPIMQTFKLLPMQR